MIRQNRKPRHVDAKAGGLDSQLIFDSDLAVIEVLSRHGIVTLQKILANDPIPDMDGRNFFW